MMPSGLDWESKGLSEVFGREGLNRVYTSRGRCFHQSGQGSVVIVALLTLLSLWTLEVSNKLGWLILPGTRLSSSNQELHR